MTQLAKGEQVATGPTTEIQDVERRCRFDVPQQGVDVLAYIVILGALPERMCVLVVVGDRLCVQLLDLTRFVGGERCRHPPHSASRRSELPRFLLPCCDKN